MSTTTAQAADDVTTSYSPFGSNDADPFHSSTSNNDTKNENNNNHDESSNDVNSNNNEDFVVAAAAPEDKNNNKNINRSLNPAINSSSDDNNDDDDDDDDENYYGRNVERIVDDDDDDADAHRYRNNNNNNTSNNNRNNNLTTQNHVATGSTSSGNSSMDNLNFVPGSASKSHHHHHHRNYNNNSSTSNNNNSGYSHHHHHHEHKYKFSFSELSPTLQNLLNSYASAPKHAVIVLNLDPKTSTRNLNDMFYPLGASNCEVLQNESDALFLHRVVAKLLNGLYAASKQLTDEQRSSTLMNIATDSNSSNHHHHHVPSALVNDTAGLSLGQRHQLRVICEHPAHYKINAHHYHHIHRRNQQQGVSSMTANKFTCGIVTFPSEDTAKMSCVKLNNFVPHGQTNPLLVVHGSCMEIARMIHDGERLDRVLTELIADCSFTCNRNSYPSNFDPVQAVHAFHAWFGLSRIITGTTNRALADMSNETLRFAAIIVEAQRTQFSLNNNNNSNNSTKDHNNNNNPLLVSHDPASADFSDRDVTTIGARILVDAAEGRDATLEDLGDMCTIMMEVLTCRRTRITQVAIEACQLLYHRVNVYYERQRQRSTGGVVSSRTSSDGDGDASSSSIVTTTGAASTTTVSSTSHAIQSSSTAEDSVVSDVSHVPEDLHLERLQPVFCRCVVRQLISATISREGRIGAAIVCGHLFDRGVFQGSPYGFGEDVIKNCVLRALDRPSNNSNNNNTMMTNSGDALSIPSPISKRSGDNNNRGGTNNDNINNNNNNNPTTSVGGVLGANYSSPPGHPQERACVEAVIALVVTFEELAARQGKRSIVTPEATAFRSALKAAMSHYAWNPSGSNSNSNTIFTLSKDMETFFYQKESHHHINNINSNNNKPMIADQYQQQQASNMYNAALTALGTAIVHQLNIHVPGTTPPPGSPASVVGGGGTGASSPSSLPATPGNNNHNNNNSYNNNNNGTSFQVHASSGSNNTNNSERALQFTVTSPSRNDAAGNGQQQLHQHHQHPHHQHHHQHQQQQQQPPFTTNPPLAPSSAASVATTNGFTVSSATASATASAVTTVDTSRFHMSQLSNRLQQMQQQQQQKELQQQQQQQHADNNSNMNVPAGYSSNDSSSFKSDDDDSHTASDDEHEEYALQQQYLNNQMAMMAVGNGVTTSKNDGEGGTTKNIIISTTVASSSVGQVTPRKDEDATTTQQQHPVAAAGGAGGSTTSSTQFLPASSSTSMIPSTSNYNAKQHQRLQEQASKVSPGRNPYTGRFYYEEPKVVTLRTVYLSHIPGAISDEQLRVLFMHYGDINRARRYDSGAKADKNNDGSVFAFVEFQTQDAAAALMVDIQRCNAYVQIDRKNHSINWIPASMVPAPSNTSSNGNKDIVTGFYGPQLMRCHPAKQPILDNIPDADAIFVQEDSLPNSAALERPCMFGITEDQLAAWMRDHPTGKNKNNTITKNSDIADYLTSTTKFPKPPAPLPNNNNSRPVWAGHSLLSRAANGVHVSGSGSGSNSSLPLPVSSTTTTPTITNPIHNNNMNQSYPTAVSANATAPPTGPTTASGTYSPQRPSHFHHYLSGGGIGQRSLPANPTSMFNNSGGTAGGAHYLSNPASSSANSNASLQPPTTISSTSAAHSHHHHHHHHHYLSSTSTANRSPPSSHQQQYHTGLPPQPASHQAVLRQSTTTHQQQQEQQPSFQYQQPPVIGGGGNNNNNNNNNTSRGSSVPSTSSAPVPPAPSTSNDNNDNNTAAAVAVPSSRRPHQQHFAQPSQRPMGYFDSDDEDESMIVPGEEFKSKNPPYATKKRI